MRPRLLTPETLRAALRAAGVTTASELAAKLEVSQPTISRGLNQLGRGVLRLGRTRGARYALPEPVAGLLSETDKAKNEAATRDEYIRIREQFARGQEVKARSPLLSIEVVEHSSDHLLAMLEQNKLDIMIGRFTEERFSQLFDYQPLEPEPFSLVVNSEHPLNQLESTPLASLGDWPWVLYPVGTPIRERLELAFRAANIATPADSVDTISMPMFLQLLQSGPMIAMLPRSMVAAQLASGQFKELQTPLRLAPLEYGIITRKDEPLTPSAHAFVEILLDFAQQRRVAQGTISD